MNPAFLVDGITEKRFVQSICEDHPVKLTNLNGKSVTTVALAKQISSLIRLWNQRHYPIIIVVDRESRPQDPQDFARDLRAEIENQGVIDQLIIGIADRMIENWMLADPALWPGQEVPDNVDGNSGATIVKRYLPGYDKAATGPALLKRSRVSEMVKRSPSFSALKHQLAGFECHWLDR